MRLFDAAINITMYYRCTMSYDSLCKITNVIWNVDTKVLRKMFDYNVRSFYRAMFGSTVERCLY